MSTRDIIRLVERIKARNVFVQCGDTGSGGTGEPPITPGTVSQYWRGDKTWQPLTKNAVGLANVDNTADFDKPVSTATAGAINVVSLALDGKAAATMATPLAMSRACPPRSPASWTPPMPAPAARCTRPRSPQVLPDS
jgi:PPE-repeat protein